LEEIFNLVNKELKAIGKDKLLPAGAVLTGGTAKLPGAVDLAKDILGLPAQAGFPVSLGGLVDKVDEPSFATVIGLLIWGMENSSSGFKNGQTSRFIGNITDKMGPKVGSLKKWFGKFLP
jgi:cell division protein FtsA